jgi:GNAT superfamily N-acetyltransferase
MELDSMRRYDADSPSPATPGEFTAEARGRFLLASIDGAPVGCAGIRALPEVGPGVAEAKRMFTAPHARRRGVGAALLRACEDAARELGYTRLVLETGEMQPEAIALYRSLGYTDIEPFGPYAGEAIALHLGKVL